jgi:DNA-binding CsgD family transcriptional regulator
LHKHLSYARALLADDRDAEQLYASALRQDLARWPLLKARIQLAYGSWLRRQRRAVDARSPLRSAEDALKHAGATLWADRARSELRAAGERQALREVASPTPTRFAAGTLTAQEMQIARLAAQGLSNREIGERLFLSHRTVGAHLHSLFPKLDITSRGQIAARFSSQEGADPRLTPGRGQAVQPPSITTAEPVM